MQRTGRLFMAAIIVSHIPASFEGKEKNWATKKKMAVVKATNLSAPLHFL